MSCEDTRVAQLCGGRTDLMSIMHPRNRHSIQDLVTSESTQWVLLEASQLAKANMRREAALFVNALFEAFCSCESGSGLV